MPDVQISRRIAAACDGPLHLVIDPVWGLPAEAAVRVLSAEGRLINVSGLSIGYEEQR